MCSMSTNVGCSCMMFHSGSSDDVCGLSGSAGSACWALSRMVLKVYFLLMLGTVNAVGIFRA